MKSVLEGLLFIVGDDGISILEIGEVMNINNEQTMNLLKELNEDYQDEQRGIIIKKFGDRFKLTTKKEHKEYYEKLAELSLIRNLSQSALETLAIIAYNQPITRLQVDELRGVNSSQMIRNLVAKDFIKEVGRSDAVGKPRLFGITNQFLDYFGLSSIEELPKIEQTEFEQEDIELYNSKYRENEIEQL